MNTTDINVVYIYISLGFKKIAMEVELGQHRKKRKNEKWQMVGMKKKGKYVGEERGLDIRE
jgi:hypothetical protein